MKQKTFLFSFIALILFATTNSYAQNDKCSGLYTYSTKLFDESILLLPNGHFQYKCEEEFLKIHVEGNWLIRDSLLILDSYPQKDRLLVFENYKKKNRGKIVFHVFDKTEFPISYHLTYINSNSDTITLRNQWANSVIKGRILSFFIVNTAGITSPTYALNGSLSNDIKVLFENSRVFENEDWIIHNNSLIPRGFNGKIQNYALSKLSN